MYVGTQIRFQIDYIVKSSTKDVTNNRMLQNEKGIECKTRKREVENTKVGRFGRFMKSVWKIHEVARGKGPLS